MLIALLSIADAVLIFFDLLRSGTGITQLVSWASTMDKVGNNLMLIFKKIAIRYLVLAGGPPRVVGPGAPHHLHHLYGRH